jgi:hypothetical protein
MKRVLDFVGQETDEEIECEAPFEGCDRIRGSQSVVPFQFTREPLESEPVVSKPS